MYLFVNLLQWSTLHLRGYGAGAMSWSWNNDCHIRDPACKQNVSGSAALEKRCSLHDDPDSTCVEVLDQMQMTR